MIGFFVGSSYQLLSCINIKNTYFKDYDADIFTTLILTDDILEFISSNSTFARIIYVDKPQNESKNAVYRQINRLLWRKKTAKALISSNIYSDFFTPYLYSQALIYYGYALKNNPNINLHFMDEGLGCYIKTWTQTKRGIKIDRKISLLMHCYFRYCNVTKYPLVKLMQKAKDIYLYMPDLAKEYNPWPIKLIPLDNTSRQIAKAFFQKAYSNIETATYDFSEGLFLESYDRGNFTVFFDKQRQLINITSKIMGENFIVKSHPVLRDIINREYDAEIDNRTYPIEYLAAKGLLKNNILISELSTACFTIPLFFERQIKIILIYKVLDMRNELNESLEEFFVRFSKKYNFNIFITPADEKKYLEYLKDFKESNENKKSF